MYFKSRLYLFILCAVVSFFPCQLSANDDSSVTTTAQSRINNTNWTIDAHGIYRFPEIVWHTVGTAYISAQNNLISDIPIEITRHADTLTYLNLSGNRFDEIPPIVFQLSKVDNLNFSNNEIKSVSDSIQNLQALQVLNLSNNHISYLPTGIGKLTNLYDLLLSNNKLKKIPFEFKGLSNVITVDLSYNDLSTVPAFLCYLPKLKTVDLRGNPIPWKEMDTARRLFLSIGVKVHI